MGTDSLHVRIIHILYQALLLLLFILLWPVCWLRGVR